MFEGDECGSWTWKSDMLNWGVVHESKWRSSEEEGKRGGDTSRRASPQKGRIEVLSVATHRVSCSADSERGVTLQMTVIWVVRQ